MYHIDEYLADLESRIDCDEELALYAEWKRYADGESTAAPFIPRSRVKKPSALNWPKININDAIADEELMVLSQYKCCSDMLASGSHGLMQVRANYGVGIMPFFFGADMFIMPYHMNTLPNAVALSEPASAAERIINEADPSFTAGYGGHIRAVTERFLEIGDKYPKIKDFIRLEHPDMQGPMDICELLWGSEIFYAFYDTPELIHALLRKITGFYAGYMTYWLNLAGDTDSYHQYGCRLHKGRICIRDDSAMNLSESFYNEFILPYDGELLGRFGGAVHFCGRGEHFISSMQTLFRNGLYAVDMSQPELNDMDVIYKNTVDAGINLHTVNPPITGEHVFSRLSI